MAEGVSIIIPTFNGGEIFKKNIEALSFQDYPGQKEIIIIDSGSTDGTYEFALEAGAKIKRIDQKAFHHSRTRNEAVKMAHYSKIVLLVQDAIPISHQWLSKLVDSLDSPDIAAAYAQQLPHLNADLYARFESDFYSSYLGTDPILQCIDSLSAFMHLPYHEAFRRIRLNNVCAIYQQKLLLQTPFPDVTFGEDIAWALEIMKQGYKIRYQPEIKVFHSHNRSPDYRFRRAIIETITCSQILGRVEEDLSFISAKDLKQISQNITDSAQKLHIEINQKNTWENKGLHSSRVIDLLGKNPYLKRTARKIIAIINKFLFRNAVFYNMKQVHEMQLRNILQTAINQDPNKDSILDLHPFLDQAVEGVRGRMFGLVYASYKAKGNVPYEVENMIAPYLGEV